MFFYCIAKIKLRFYVAANLQKKTNIFYLFNPVVKLKKRKKVRLNSKINFTVLVSFIVLFPVFFFTDVCTCSQ